MAQNTETRTIDIIVRGQQANASINEMAAAQRVLNNQINKMGADDPNRTRLLAEYQELKGRLKAAREEMTGVAQSEEQLAAAAAKLATEQAQTVVSGQNLTASFSQMKAAAGILTGQLHELATDDPNRARLIAQVAELETRMKAAQVEMRGLGTAEEQAAAAAAALVVEQKALAAANAQALASGQRATASMSEMKAAAGLLEKQLHEVSADDPGRAQLIRDYQQLQVRLAAAGAEMRTVAKSEEQLAQEAAELAAANARTIATGQRATASFNEMKAAAALLEKQLHELAADDPNRKKLIADFQQLEKRIEGAGNEMRKTKAAADQSGGWMAKLTGLLGPLGVAFGAAFVVDMVVGFFTGASKAEKLFEASLSDLSAVTGASGQDLKFYREEAEKLGRSTTHAATEAVEAYKLIGSAKPELLTNKELLTATAVEVLALSDAAKMNLPDATDAAVGALNQFSAGADQAGRYVNVLAAGAKAGSAEIKDQTASLKNAGTVAAGAGLSIEQTVASIQALSLISIKGGEAGTGLRNVLLTLEAGAKDTNPAVVGLETALDNLAKKELGAAEMSKMFGKENVVVATQLVNARDQVKEMTKAVTGSQEAYIQAAKNTNNLEGDTKRLAGVWQGFVLKVGEGVNGPLRGLVRFVTELLNRSQPLADAFREVSDEFSQLYEDLVAVARAMGITVNAGSGAGLMIKALAAIVSAGLAPFRALAWVSRQVVEAFIGVYNWGLRVSDGIDNLGKRFDSIFNAFKTDGARAAGKAAGDAFSEGYDAAAVIKPKQVVGASGNGPARAATPADLAAQKAAAEAADKLRKQQQAQEKIDLEAHRKALEALEDLRVQAIPNRTLREIAEINLDYKRKKAAVEGSEADKTAQIALLEQARHRKVAEVRAKAAKEEQDKEKELAEKRRAVVEAIEDLRIAAIPDKTTREIAAINAEYDRKIAAVTGSEAQITEQTLLLNEERERKIAEVNKNAADEREKARKEGVDARLGQEAAEEEAQLELLQSALDRGLMAEQAYADAVYDVKRVAKENEIELLKQKFGEESAEVAKAQSQLRKMDAQQTKEEKAQAKERAEFREKMDRQALRNAMAVAGSMMDLLREESAAYEAFKIVRKAMALFEIGLNLQKELAANRAAAAALNLLTAGLGGGPWLITQNLFSIAAAATSAMKVAALRSGGNTSTGGEILPMDIALSMLNGTSGGRAVLPGELDSFVPGGPVTRPRIGLIGEAGAELVVPNWLYTEPRAANVMGALEAMIQQRQFTPFATPFAAGGSTGEGRRSALESAAPVSLSADTDVAEFFRQLISEVRGQREDIAAWQREFEVRFLMRDFDREYQEYKRVNTGGGLR